jgi:hypothetical protein
MKLTILVVVLAFAVGGCAVSPTPVADAVIDKVTSGSDDNVTRAACQDLGRNMQTPNASVQELLDNMSLNDSAVEAAAASGTDSGRSLAAAWSNAYKAVAAQDQEGLYTAMEEVFAACGMAGVDMSWE